MYELKLDIGRFYRVKCGQTAQEIEKALCIPVNGDVFEGMIIPLPQRRYSVYTAKAGDTYYSIAQKYGVDGDQLKRENGGRPVYPTCRLFIPQ